MSRSSQRKERYESIETSENHSNEGTSARTRPFSFDDIMLRRKAKKLTENENHGTLHQTPEDGDLTKVSDHNGSKRGNGHNKDSSVHIPCSSVEDHGKEKSRKKGRDVSFKADHSAKDKAGKNHLLGSMSDAKNDKDFGAEYRARDHEKINSVRKRDERHGNEFGDGHTKKHPRVMTVKDVHMDRDRHRDREKSEREYRGKNYNGVEEKIRERNLFKEQSFGKGHNLQKSGGRERRESLKHYHEELRPKRTRSRSREHNDRTISHSPMSHKHASYHGRGHGELPSQMPEWRSRREHSDANWSGSTKNGSNKDYRKHGVLTSGLGGYSPRKRRTAAVAKTPSPIKRSPEKRSAKWDLAPEVTAGTSAVSTISNFHASNKSTSSNIHEVVSSIHGASSSMNPLSIVLSHTLSMNKSASIDSIQLTQATRPMRRLYLENLPASTSEKAVMEWLNNLLISSGVNHVKGTQPCISCTIHKEKSQALVELLTPEDAVAACSFDGFLFLGSNINIRRPKDFVDVATGEAEKSVDAVDAVDAISNTVVDSPNKIFIGGISQCFSPKMLMEIASAFGKLKAFQFEKNQGHDKPHAFIEYVDESVTLKACAGLNGMKLGGQVITAVQAIPCSLLLETSGDPHICGIPEHAKPLLEKPMPILMLRNVFMPEALPSLSSSEIEEVLEDVRLECARFGTVRSVNVVECGVNAISIEDPCQVKEDQISIGTEQNSVSSAIDTKVGTVKDVNAKTVESSSVREDESEGNGLDEPYQHNECDVTEEEPCQRWECDGGIALEVAWKSEPFCQQLSTLGDELDSKSDKVSANVHINVEVDSIAEEVSNLDDQRDVITVHMKEINAEMNSRAGEASILEDLGGKSSIVDGVVVELNAVEKGKGVGQASDVGPTFDPGCVFVEFGRTEASCMAAHFLHGRLFDDRIMTVEYVPPHIYQAMFPK